MRLKSEPPLVHTAFNPAILELARQYPDEEKAQIIIEYNSNERITLEREMFNDVVTFDVSPTLKRLFMDKQETVLPDIYVDLNLVVPYVLNAGDGRVAISMPLIAVNAVSQIGETSDLTRKEGSFLTSFNRLTKYSTYPLDVSCLSYEFDSPGPSTISGNAWIGFSEDLVNVLKPHFSINIPDGKQAIIFSNQLGWEELRDFESEIITDDLGNPILIRNSRAGYIRRILYIENKCTPINPFYVRWINQLGGWDHWMFSFRQEKSREVDNLQSYNPYIKSQETVKGTTKTVFLEGRETITVGGTHLTAIEYQAVSKLAYSPCVEWYNKSLNKWQTIIVTESLNVEDTHSSTQSIEFVFELPKPQIQF